MEELSPKRNKPSQALCTRNTINAWDITLGLMRSSRREGRGGGGGGEKGEKGKKGDCLNVFCLFLGLLCFSFRPAEHLIELNYSSTNERMLRSFLMPAN